VLTRGQIVHGIEQDPLDDRAQPARPGVAFHGLACDLVQRRFAHVELAAFHLEQLGVLLDDGVLGLTEDAHQGMGVEFFERGHDGQPPHELGDKTIRDQILWLDALQHLAHIGAFVARLHLGREADPALFRAIPDDLLQTGEGPTDDEKHVGGIDLQEFLLRMLAPPLRRHRCHGALHQLQQGLLHALAGDIARDRRVVRLARDLVDLVDVDDAVLRLLDLVVALLQQFLDDVLDIFADVARLGKRGGIGNGERHIQQPRQRFREQGFARAGRADHQDVALGEFDLVAALAKIEALVMVVDRHRQDLLRAILADDVLIERRVDLFGFRQARRGRAVGVLHLFANDVVAEVDAFVADEYRGAGDQLADLVLALAAERAVEKLARILLVVVICHEESCPAGSRADLFTMPVPRAFCKARPQSQRASSRGWLRSFGRCQVSPACSRFATTSSTMPYCSAASALMK